MRAVICVLIAAHALAGGWCHTSVRTYQSCLTQVAGMMARCVTMMILAALALDVGELASAGVGGILPVSKLPERYVARSHHAYYH